MLSSVFGISMAWLNTTFIYWGSSWLKYALVLPLAMPIYVLAFVFLGIFGVGGSVQNQLQAWWPMYQQIDMRSPFIVMLVLSLSLFPYVYLLVRNALLSQGVQLLEASRTLGLNPYQSFARIIVPAIRPAVVASLTLVSMETLADFGGVSVFNYDTFTTTIYKTWFGLFNLTAATQLASILMLIALLLPVSERLLRGRARFSETPDGPTRKPYLLHGFQSFAAFTACFALFAVAFLFPMIQLLVWAWQAYIEFGWDYRDALIRTMMLACMVTAVGVPLCFVVVFWSRFQKSRASRILPRLLSLGYALPGTVVAAGAVSITGLLSSQVAGIDTWWARMLLPGGLVLLILACLSHFAALAIGSLESGLSRIRKPMLEAALLLGLTRIQTVWRIYLPLLAPAVSTAGLLFLVETVREMPITLLLRPFGWDTLAVRIFEFTTEGEWSRAAIPALLLVAVGLIPVLLAMRRQYPVTDRKTDSN